MKIMTLSVGFWVEKWQRNSLKRLKKIDFLAKNQYLFPLRFFQDNQSQIALACLT